MLASRRTALAAATAVLVLCGNAAAWAQGGESTAPASTSPSSGAGLSPGQLVGQRMIYSYSGTRPPSGLVRRIARARRPG